MPDYRRCRVAGGTFFFTVVTHGRRPILADELGRSCLSRAMRQTRARHPFQVIAMVLLPDHLHAVWSLPQGDQAYSRRWSRIKELFTQAYLTSGGTESVISPSRSKHRERAIWQRRFWEHACQDEDDLSRCVDYIHWNPVKHGLVECVKDYPWSTFHRHVRTGDYEEDWGRSDPSPPGFAGAWE